MGPRSSDRTILMKFHCRRRKMGPSWACLPAGSRAVRTDLDLRLNPTSLLLIPAPLKCEGAPNHCFTYESFTYTFKMIASRPCNVCFCGTQLNKSVVICIIYCIYLICKPSKYVKELFYTVRCLNVTGQLLYVGNGNCL